MLEDSLSIEGNLVSALAVVFTDGEEGEVVFSRRIRKGDGGLGGLVFVWIDGEPFSLVDVVAGVQWELSGL